MAKVPKRRAFSFLCLWKTSFLKTISHGNTWKLHWHLHCSLNIPSIQLSQGPWTCRSQCLELQLDFFKKDLLFICLKGRVKEGETERYAFHWFSPQMATTTRAWPVWSQEQGTPSGLPGGWQYFSHRQQLPRCITGNWISSRAARTQEWHFNPECGHPIYWLNPLNHNAHPTTPNPN